MEESDVGNYNIKLKNTSGEASAELTLVLIGASNGGKTKIILPNLKSYLKCSDIVSHCPYVEPPGAPGTPDVLEVTDNTITLHWKAPESDGNSPITEYILEYHAKGEFT